MNKEFWYSDGKVFVKDTKGQVKNVVYNANLRQILIQENLIETIENEIKKLEKKNKKFDECYKNIDDVITDIHTPVIAFSLFVIIQLIICIVTLDFSRIFALPNLLTLLGMGVLCYGLTTKRSMTYLKRCDKANGRECQISFLEKQIVKEKEKLSKLQQSKGHFEQYHTRIISINTKMSVRKIYRNYKFYYNCGYLASNFYEHYQENKSLPEHLHKHYTDSEIKQIEAYIQNEGPRLTKRLF